MEINFPAEHGWKESLLGDMEGRLKQVLKVGGCSFWKSVKPDREKQPRHVMTAFEGTGHGVHMTLSYDF